MLGHSFPKTLRLKENIRNNKVTFFVDGGSTCYFIQDGIAKFLDLPILQSQNFHVLVGNCDRLPCNIYCPSVPICFDETIFIDLYILPLSGVEVVLGIQ